MKSNGQPLANTCESCDSKAGKARFKLAHVFFTRWLLPLLYALALLMVVDAGFAATVKREPWGTDPAGHAVDRYTITSGTAEVSVVTYGARIVGIRVPDRQGTLANVVLSRDSVQGYSSGLGPVMGATIGRYANRIKGGSFQLDGVTSTLPTNNGPNTLHGGPQGFNIKTWQARPVHNGVAMKLISPDGDMGFPGELTLQVTFTLESKKGSSRFAIDYRATSTRDTVLNLTNHAFFNLSNSSDQPVLKDSAMIAADSYTPTDATGIPTGSIASVAATPFDFRAPRTIAATLPQRGYDVNFVLRSPGIDHLAAEVDDASSGRTLRVYTTEPGLQLFVPHWPVPAPGGTVPAAPRFPAIEAFCLETQHFPDSPNQPSFPSTTLKKGAVFHSETVYVFGHETK